MIGTINSFNFYTHSGHVYLFKRVPTSKWGSKYNCHPYIDHCSGHLALHIANQVFTICNLDKPKHSQFYFCIPCQLAKSHRLPFDLSTSHKIKFFELVNINLLCAHLLFKLLVIDIFRGGNTGYDP